MFFTEYFKFNTLAFVVLFGEINPCQYRAYPVVKRLIEENERTWKKESVLQNFVCFVKENPSEIRSYKSSMKPQ
jgi:hypothetical protein